MISVMRKAVVNTMKKEVEGHCLGVVRKPVILRVQKISVEDVFEYSPIAVSKNKVNQGLNKLLLPISQCEPIIEWSCPHYWNEPIWCACEELKNWVIIDSDISNWIDQMLRFVDKCNVVVPLKAAFY
jgi:hypothetical protein